MARVIIADGDALRSSLADYVADLSAASTKPRFVVALSGGSMPKLLSGLLDKGIDWARWDIFFADERCVPADHEDSNLRACTEQLFSRIEAQKPVVHALDVSLAPAKAAEAYAAELARCGGFFDLALLGMGPDGHTASLFPGHREMARSDDAVAAEILDSPKPPPERVTFTLRTLRNARNVAFVATGASKQKVMAEIMRLDPAAAAYEYADPPAPYPAAEVRAHDGTATWFLDTAAVAGLPALETASAK